MAAPSSPVSDLSALNSEDFEEDARRSRSDRGASTDPFEENDSSIAMPPSKRRRTTKARAPRQRASSPAASNAAGVPASTANAKLSATDPDADVDLEDDGYGTDVSSDSSGTGSVEGSPLMIKELGMNDEYSYSEEQVQICQWDYCKAGDLGNQDELVKHINDIHVVEAKQRSFVCEWYDCKAKFRPQMSAYALRAHLRSHTKEKPFFCTLPECDRSFTRSDALAKHMRTVHETESIRTADHYYIKKLKSGPDASGDGPAQGETSKTADGASNAKPAPKLKLVFNHKYTINPSEHKPAPATNGTTEITDEELGAPGTPLSPTTRDTLFGPLPEALQFTEAETSMPRNKLYRLLRRQLHWAEEESEQLNKRIKELENQKRGEWLTKELVLENVLEAEQARAKKRGVFDFSGQDDLFGEPDEIEWGDRPVSDDEKTRIVAQIRTDIVPSAHLPLKEPGSQPWYRLQAEVEAEAEARALEEAKARAKARALAGEDEDQREDEQEQDLDGEEDEEMPDANTEDEAELPQGDGESNAEEEEEDDDDDEDDDGEEEEEGEEDNDDDEDDDDENETKVVIMTLGPGGDSGPTSVANGGDETEEDEDSS